MRCDIIENLMIIKEALDISASYLTEYLLC